MVVWNTLLAQYNHPLHAFVAQMAPEPDRIEHAVATFYIAKPSEGLHVRVQRTDLGSRVEWELWDGTEQVAVYATQEEADAACEALQPMCEYCADFAQRTAAV